jgi:BCCT family betaine/carnitine transporter
VSHYSAGVAVGLFVYGVSEPLWHQNSHWFAQAGYHSQDEIDMFAINLTVTNWAIAGWAPYLVVAVCMGLAGHRFNLPLTFRSCLYPILQEYTWGWIGDVIDGFTIVVTGTSITRIVQCARFRTHASDCGKFSPLTTCLLACLIVYSRWCLHKSWTGCDSARRRLSVFRLGR